MEKDTDADLWPTHTRVCILAQTHVYRHGVVPQQHMGKT